MGSTHEVERKFDVDSTFALPALTRVRGVSSASGVEERHLDAVYYDTDDLRLARNRLVLRRRRGGADQGWHLKLPAADGERDEIQRSLGDPDVIPEDLLDLVSVRTRGHALRPVAHLSTVRRAQRLSDATGADLIEVADDLVKAQTMGDRTVVSTWREIELEAVDRAGTRVLPATAKALREAGARPSHAPAKLLRALGDDVGPAEVEIPAGPLTVDDRASAVIHGYLAEQTARLLEEDPRVRLDTPEAVHDMRVAARRLRSTVQTFRPLFDPARAAEIQTGLRALGEALGVPRDAEVQLARHLRAVDSQPTEAVLGPVRARVEQTFLGERLRGAQRAVAYLRSEQYLTFIETLLAFVADTEQTAPARRPASQVLPKLARKADRRLTRRVARAERAAAGRPSDVAHHDARKAAKRLRYACEAVAPVFGPDAARLGRRAKKVQDMLGEHQDCVVARERMRTLAIAANLAGESSYTYGLLTGAENARAERTIDEFTARWPGLARRRYRRWLHG
ncbi:CYTH and CHAD domain-containing protein [Parafrankia elaeagni]|uniref:CYTH and CHAD domain-containing protein n=1 Tax=Parafrankia elaeagni TaxID=222534 RepID=UPI000365CE34|nr:CYTH and CHAD domain-containing protein [Parafrankia elaeagni]